MKTIEQKVEWISFLHKQNLNGRETEDELFEAGVLAGIEETEENKDEFALEFAIFSKDYAYHNSHNVWIDSFNVLGDRFTSQQLMVKFKKQKMIMTLKERLKKEGFSNCDYLEIIADNHAIQFTDWCEDNYYPVGIKGLWYDDVPSNKFAKRFSTKQLLEIYKKENGL